MTRADPDPEFVEDVRRGLTADPKRVPPKWLYDERGSELFEKITELPEYYLTDTERRIFRTYADEIVAACPCPTGFVELGAGSAEKTRILVDALVDRQGSTVYCPVDISQAALQMAGARFEDRDEVRVEPVRGGFVQALSELPAKNTPARLIAFIGSSIGNMPMDEQKALLRRIRDGMRPQDRFLLGTDMRKDRETMIAAYDDSEGVTATFTRNLLHRMNRELDADFDVDAFEHVVRFDEEKSAIESYLESQRDQEIHLEALDLTVRFAEGERMHVEDSYKYTPSMIEELLEAARLALVESFYDEDRWFGVHLLGPDDAEHL